VIYRVIESHWTTPPMALIRENGVNAEAGLLQGGDRRISVGYQII